MSDYRDNPARKLVPLLCLGLLVSGCGFFAAIDQTPTDCGRAEFVVTMEADVVTGTCNDDCSLRDAVIAANECPGENVIRLDEGVFTLSIRGLERDGYDLDSTRGDLDLTGDTTVRGASQEATRITGNDWRFRILQVGRLANVRLEDLTIEGGTVAGEYRDDPDDFDFGWFGGGIYSRATSLTLERVAVEGNRARAGGGVYQQGGSLAVVDSTVRDNHVRTGTSRHTGYGGGIYAERDLLVRSSHIVDNTVNGFGGGIANYRTTEDLFGELDQMVVVNSVIEGNEARQGRGIDDSRGGGVFAHGLELAGSRVAGNIARTGAGLHVRGPSQIRGSVIVDNRRHSLQQDYSGIAPHRPEGGGIFVVGALAIERSAVLGNASTAGGGLFLSDGSDTSIINSTLADNRTQDVGSSSAVFMEKGSELDLRFSTVYANTIDFDEEVNDQNPRPLPIFRIANNVFHRLCSSRPGTGQMESLGGNVKARGQQCQGDWHPTDRIVPDTGLVTPIDDSVLFTVIGGPAAVPVFRLQEDSPAVDIGSEVECPPTDQVGNPRPESPEGECDAGAYELQAR